MSRLQVLIQNPKSRNGYTSLKSARRYVERGRARWVREDAVLQFIDDAGDYRSVAVEQSRERLMQIGYDRDVNSGTLASLDAIKHLPVAGDPAKCFTLARNAAPAMRPFRRLAPMRVLVSAGQAVGE